MQALETIEKDGHKIRIFYDEHAESPLEWGQPYGLMHWHRRGFLGEQGSPDELRALEKDGAEIVPLYLYEHGGQTVSSAPFSCPWDSGQVGALYVTAEQGRKEWGRVWRKKARALMLASIKTLDQYLRGDVYGFTIEGPICDDSCWGFYGMEYVKAQALEALQGALEREEKEAKACQLVLAL